MKNDDDFLGKILVDTKTNGLAIGREVWHEMSRGSKNFQDHSRIEPLWR